MKQAILDLEITPDKRDQFLNDLVMIEKIADQFGRDCSQLFAELCIIYDIKDEDDLKDIDKSMLRNHCVNILTILATAIQEVDILRSQDDLAGSIIVKSSNYQNIFSVLNNVKTMYMSLIDMIQDKKYLSKEFIDAIHERLSFLINHEFEELRARFKTVESVHNILSQPIEPFSPLTM